MVKEDLRIVKTKEKLCNALISLLKEVPISKIKISELCKMADISRATFYNNFNSIEEVLSYYISLFEEPWEEKMKKEIEATTLDEPGALAKIWMGFIFPVIAELEKRKKDFCDILNTQSVSSDFYNAILNMVTGQTKKMLSVYKTQYKLGIPDEIAIAYSAGGLCNLTIQLLEFGDKYTLEEKQYYIYHVVYEISDYYFQNHQSGEID